jgi:pyridoxamine 5'-phosphate oxidase
MPMKWRVTSPVDCSTMPPMSQPKSIPTREELHKLRVDYGASELNEADVASDPIEQFGRWFADAKSAGVYEPNAMTLATADAGGKPSARIVLLKDVDAAGFTFFTNYGSQKGEDLAANPRASLVFFWGLLERQVRVDGTVARVSKEESKAYFDMRPRGARIGAWASHQSRGLTSRAELEAAWAEFEAKFPDDVPLPDWWGGYRVKPEAIEFWQGRQSRLHDRLVYERSGVEWVLSRLSP